MVAVTTHVQHRRRSTGGVRHLAAVPQPPDQGGWRGSVRVVRPPITAGVAHERATTGRAPLPSHPLRVPEVAPAAYGLRRAVALVLAAGLLLAAWAAVGVPAHIVSASGSSSPAPRPAAPTVVVVPGDSVWSIASRLQPTGDVRPLVDRLVAAHGGAMLRAGERIAVPRS